MRSTTFLQHVLVQRLTLAVLLSGIILIYIGAKAEASEPHKGLMQCSEWSSTHNPSSENNERLSILDLFRTCEEPVIIINKSISK